MDYHRLLWAFCEIHLRWNAPNFRDSDHPLAIFLITSFSAGCLIILLFVYLSPVEQAALPLFRRRAILKIFSKPLKNFFSDVLFLQVVGWQPLALLKKDSATESFFEKCYRMSLFRAHLESYFCSRNSLDRNEQREIAQIFS